MAMRVLSVVVAFWELVLFLLFSVAQDKARAVCLSVEGQQGKEAQSYWPAGGLQLCSVEKREVDSVGGCQAFGPNFSIKWLEPGGKSFPSLGLFSCLSSWGAAWVAPGVLSLIPALLH